MKTVLDKMRPELNSLSEQAAHLLKAQAVSIWLRDGDLLRLAADTSHTHAKFGGEIYYHLGEGLTGWVAHSGKPLRITQDGLKTHHAWHGKYDSLMWSGKTVKQLHNTFMAVPILAEGKTLGVMRVSSLKKDKEFTEAEQRLLETIANLVASLLKTNPEFLVVASGPYLFVLIPFAEKFRDIYTLGIKSVATKLGFRCERVDEIEFNDAILSRIYDGIQRADLVIAEMTGRNPNVFYEVGYAHALSKEVVLLTQKACDIPFDLAGHNHIIYTGSITSLQQRLEKRLKAFLRNKKMRETTDAET